MLVQDHQLKDIFCRFEIFLKLSLPNLFQSYLSEVWMKTIVLFPGIWHKSSPGQLSSTDNPQYNSQVSKQQRTKVQQWGNTLFADELNNADMCVYCLILQRGWLGIFKTTNTHPGKQSLNNYCLRLKLPTSFNDIKWLISSSQYSCLARRTAACLSSENRLSLSTQPRLQGWLPPHFKAHSKGKEGME